MKDELSDDCLTRHWCAESEEFTGADSLMTRLEQGWTIVGVYIDKTHSCSSQPVTIYVFRLRFGREAVTMNVVANPFIERYVDQHILSYEKVT